MISKASTARAEPAAVDTRRVDGASSVQNASSQEDSFSAFAERHRLVDPQSPDAAIVVGWFASIGDRLLAADGTTLKTKVSYHLADSNEISAYVATVGGEARIVITKGLLDSVIKNEDQLATIIGHELMHVHFSERFDDGGERIRNTKLEEYIADVGSVARWMIKAGYAPHQAVAVFDGLRESSELHKERGGRLLKPWVAFNDVHGLLENRSQAINALIANEIKEKGQVPLEITPITGEMKVAIRSSTHVTHIQKLITDPSYAQSSAGEKFQKLLHEVRSVTPVTAGRVDELGPEMQKVLRDIPVTAATVEAVYSAIKENKERTKCELLNLVYRVAKQNGKELAPPAELREIAKEIRSFVRATSDRSISESAKRIAAFAREWNGMDPGVRAAISHSFDSPIGQEDTMPWARHLQIARSMAERGTTDGIEALWAIGVYDVTILNFTPDQLLSRFQKVPELTMVQGGRESTLSPSGEWARASTVQTLADGIREASGLRTSYREFVHAETGARAHKKRLEGSVGESDPLRFGTLEEVPPEVCAANLEAVVAAFADQLAHPDKLDFHASGSVVHTLKKARSARDDDDSSLEEGDPDTSDATPDVEGEEPSHFTRLSVSEELSDHYRYARILTATFDSMLAIEEPTVRRQATEAIRRFFLRHDGPCYATLIGSHPEDAISTQAYCRHPLVSFAARCPALRAEERVEFLRGLEHRLPTSTWEQAFFSGYTFANDREKLRHLQSVAVHQESARTIGADLIVELSYSLRPGKQSFISILAEHKAFFPALRQVSDDARQGVLDHIEEQKKWDAPLEDLVDAFWAMEQAKLFPAAESGVRELLRGKIIEGVSALTDPHERRTIAERILLSPVDDDTRISQLGGIVDGDSRVGSRRAEMINQSAGLLSLKDPVLREAITNVWCEAVRVDIRSRYAGVSEGRDDNTARYIEVVKPELEAIANFLRNRLPVQERREMLGALANELELQEHLAYLLRDCIVDRSRAGVADAHEYFRSAEAGFEFLNLDTNRRDAVVKFLSQPLTPHSLTSFARQADISRNRETDAVHETLKAIRKHYEGELADIETKLATLNYYWDPDKWIENAFNHLGGAVLDSQDRQDLEAFDSDTLVEKLRETMPAILDDAALARIVADLEGSEWELSFAEARDHGRSAHAKMLQEYRDAISAEELLFRETLDAAMKEVLQGGALETTRRSVLQKIAGLPAYEFVEKIEERISDAKTGKALEAVLARALAGLAKSLERERLKGEAQIARETAAFEKDISRREKKASESKATIKPAAERFQKEAQTFLKQATWIVEKSECPVLLKLASCGPDELLSEFDDDTQAIISRELERLRDRMAREIDILSPQVSQHEQRISKFNKVSQAIERDLPDLKKSPVPVLALVEEASEGFTGIDELEGRTGPVFSRKPKGDDFETFTALFARLYPEKLRGSSIPISPLEEQHGRQLYELFWSQSAEVRAVTLKLLILPPESEYQDRKSGKDSHFKQAFSFVADQIFPQGMKYGTESRKILKVFLEETDPSLRGFMLAALMGASEKIAGAPEEYSAGKRLAMVLSMLGPAEKKLGQAINSHPLTPEDLRSDTKSIKSMSDPLPRWELLERVAEALPQEYKDVAIPRIGKTLGAASYYIAVDCGDTVLSILRPHARTLARTGLDRMHGIAIRLSHDASLKEVAEPFIESIQQAREMIALETDHDKGIIQQQNAWRRYEGASVIIEGERFDVQTAAWKGCGPEFRHQEKVRGEHFLDMWERDGGNDPFLRKAALAHLTIELSNILSGDAFDHDRHGSQSKISKGGKEHSIGLFDHGCMALTPPTKEEKEELATILCDLVEGYMNGKTGILQRAHEIIREKREREGKVPSYLVSVERGLLALNDFMRFDSKGESALLQKSDLGSALVAVLRTGKVDPIFAKTVASRFGGISPILLSMVPHKQLCAQIADKIEARLPSKTSISLEMRAQRTMLDPIVFDLPRSE